MSLLGISPDAWSAAAGAVVGGSFTLFAQIANDHNQAKTARQAAEDQAAATAILLQDDFWHYQAMLARALDRCTGGNRPNCCPRKQRSTIYAALEDEQTNTVAAAQGWVDYLIGTRQTITGDVPALNQDFAETMQMTFKRLETGRAALAKLARRPASPFSDSLVLKELDHCKTVDELLSQRCNQTTTPPSAEQST